MKISKPQTPSEVSDIVNSSDKILPIGGRTKMGLSIPLEGVTVLDMTGIHGIGEYEPQEFTFTAKAGTKISQVESLLAKNSQFLPFDPLLAKHGATLGGTLASGLSGSGRFKYGGVRDFILGIKFINSKGEEVSSGGKVVKNAAGFDLPKLMVGSLGVFGVLVELTLKVLPRPEEYASLVIELENLEEALQIQTKLAASPLDLSALDLECFDGSYRLFVRIGGFRNTIRERSKRLQEFVGKGNLLKGDQEQQLWEDACELSWIPPDWALVKVPLKPSRIVELEQTLTGKQIIRRYSCAGQIGLFTFIDSADMLDEILNQMSLSGLMVFGNSEYRRLGVEFGNSFYRRVKVALDPENRFLEV